jgi:hypothetical protein
MTDIETTSDVPLTGTEPDQSIDKAPPPKRVHRRTELERLELRYQSKQNVVETSKVRVKARQAELDVAQRELFVSEQELDLIGRMIDLAKAQQELAQ